MSGVEVGPLVLYSAERDRVLRLQRLRGVALATVVASVYSGAEQLLEREVACGVVVAGAITGQAYVDDVMRVLVCGGQFLLDGAEVAPVQAWLAKVYGA